MSSQEDRSGQGREMCLHTGSHHVSTGGFGIDAFELSSLDPVLLDELVRLVWRCRGRFEYSLRRARGLGLGIGIGYWSGWDGFGGGRDANVIAKVYNETGGWRGRPK